MFNAVKKLES